MTTLFLILIGVVILLCIWLNNVSSRIGIPTLLAFIVLGMVFGNNGLIPLHFEDYDFAKETCTVALIFNIVFCIVLVSISLQGSLIPWVSRKLDMLDAKTDVMKTFNDYSERTQMQFGSIEITPGSNWDGKRVKDLGLPGNMLIALVIRGKERITARGDTVLEAGDVLVILRSRNHL